MFWFEKLRYLLALGDLCLRVVPENSLEPASAAHTHRLQWCRTVFLCMSQMSSSPSGSPARCSGRACNAKSVD